MLKPWYFFLILNSLLTISLHYFGQNFRNSWLIFALWFINFCFAIVFFFFTYSKNIFNKLFLFVKRNCAFVGLVFLLAVITRLFLLTKYPFVTVADELRDAGLNALLIKNGGLKDLFGFGSYDGYGNFIPLISYFFIPFFDSSSLIYILPSAFIGIMSVMATFILAYFIGGRKIALLASLFLIASPVHLHYSRTELLVILDSFLAPLIVISSIQAFRKIEWLFVLGLVSGFSLHFYAGIRGIIFISWLFVLGYWLWRFTRHSNKKILQGIVILLIGLSVGLGPTVNKLIIKENSLTKIGQHNIISLGEKLGGKTNSEKFTYLSQLYKSAFLAYGFKNATDNHFHFNYPMPLLNFPINFFFLAGLILLVIRIRKIRFPTYRYLLFLIFLFPVTNAVLIDVGGENHRLVGILPVLMIIAGFGFESVFSKFRRLGKLIALLVLIIYLIYSFHLYFFKRVSDFRFGVSGNKEYLFQKAINFIRNDRQYLAYFILDEEGFFSPMHYEEKIFFFTNPKKVKLVNKEEFLRLANLNNNSVFISFKYLSEFKNADFYKIDVDCSKKKIFPNYDCPIGGNSYSFYLINYLF